MDPITILIIATLATWGLAFFLELYLFIDTQYRISKNTGAIEKNTQDIEALQNTQDLKINRQNLAQNTSNLSPSLQHHNQHTQQGLQLDNQHIVTKTR